MFERQMIVTEHFRNKIFYRFELFFNTSEENKGKFTISLVCAQ